jgi:predicted signal transduction protein with EAL and GGDEF domain
VGDCQLAIKPRIGVAIPPINDDFSGDQLTTKADAAMYRAKKKHSRCNVLFGQQETDATETFAAFRPSMRAMYGADFGCFAWLKVKDQIHHNQHHHGNSQ